MKKTAVSLLVVMVILLSCKQKEQAAGKNGEPEDTIQSPVSDSTSIRITVTGFYEWYHTHYPSFNRFDLYSGLKKEDAPPYKINWEEVTRYQQFIRDSVPWLGDIFLQNQKRFLEQCDSAFKVDVEDDIPYGFDYDWYTNSQEGTEYLLEDLRNPVSRWDIDIAGNEATVQVNAERTFNNKKESYTAISLVLKKDNRIWTISKIGSD